MNGLEVDAKEVRRVADILLEHLKNMPRGNEATPLSILSAKAYLLGRAMRASGLPLIEHNLDQLVDLIELGYLEHGE